MAYLPPFRVLDMLAAAMNRAGTQDPAKVAFALEGAKYAGPTGDSWMRADDHQIIAPVYVMSFVKAGEASARHEAEGTGYGWRTDELVPAHAIVPPIRCSMDRPRP
jgi:branched-chain amino acid transport system substrate-binding protein